MTNQQLLDEQLPTLANLIHWFERSKPIQYPYNGEFIKDDVACHDLVQRTNKPYNESPWFKETDGAYKFILEVAGFGQEHFEIEIKCGALIIEANKPVGEGVSHCFAERYLIPEHNSLDLENASVKVEYGVLIIFFPAKKVAPQTIKLL